MATHSRYPEIKKWAQSTGRRSIQLWMLTDTVNALDRLCRERNVGRAELLDSLICEAGGQCGAEHDAETVLSLHSDRVLS